ncbi:hypothetical protein [Mycobacterium tuberculosis]|uniref:hypothetical protein n=1 Tax=Mycobacterium tuberculosis TaxID=1773 RepID=UPI003F4AB076
MPGRYARKSTYCRGHTRPRRVPPESVDYKDTVSTKGIKVIDRDGIEAVVARLRRQGQRI